MLFCQCKFIAQLCNDFNPVCKLVYLLRTLKCLSQCFTMMYVDFSEGMIISQTINEHF